MTLQKFIERLNWRQVAVHFIATWFFMYSFQTLAVLHNINLIGTVRQSTKENLIERLNENGTAASDVFNFTLWTGIGNTIGLLVAFIISLTIAIRRNWFWFNSLIVLILAYTLSWFNLLGWRYLRNIFLTPGEIFKNTTLEFLTNGIILLTIGLFIFFLTKGNKFIAIGNRTVV